MLRNNPQKSSADITSIVAGNVDTIKGAANDDDLKENAKVTSKGNSSMGNGTNRLPIVDAIRVLCSFIIVCAHMDMLFRQVKGNDSRRLRDDDHKDGETIRVALKCITATVVQGFFNLSGLVSAIPFINNRVNSLRSSLLSRPFRMLLPLAVVQVVDLILYLTDLSYFNYQSKPKWHVLQRDFSSLRFVFVSSLNGPLWVMESFFYLPYAIFPILSVAAMLRLSRIQRIHFFLFVSLFVQSLVRSQDDFLDRLVAGLLGVACGYYLYGEASEEASGNNGLLDSFLFVVGLLPWNPLVPLDHRIWICRIGAPCAILFIHRLVRRWHRLFQGLMERLARVGPYTFQVYIWHHVIYGWAGKTLIPFLSRDVFAYQVVCIPLVWTIVGGISYVTYHRLERPVARYIKTKWIAKYTTAGISQAQQATVPDNSVQDGKTPLEV